MRKFLHFVHPVLARLLVQDPTLFAVARNKTSLLPLGRSAIACSVGAQFPATDFALHLMQCFTRNVPKGLKSFMSLKSGG